MRNSCVPQRVPYHLFGIKVRCFDRAHGHGGDRWTLAQKRAFANDPENLLATWSSANRSKGAKGPDQWLPTVNQCEYLLRWQVLANKYELNVLPIETDAFHLAICE